MATAGYHHAYHEEEPPASYLSPCVLGFVSFRPVFTLGGEIRSAEMREVLSHIDSFLVCQGVGLTERHVVFHKGRSGIGTRHAGTNVEGILAS